jgi:TPP-dependent pyruvate/acetoin dehydrogenase alpha subunit
MENRDPITNYRKRLLEFNIDEKIINEIEDKVKQQVEDATEISKSSPIPDVKEIFTDVWADGGYKWHN